MGPIPAATNPTFGKKLSFCCCFGAFVRNWAFGEDAIGQNCLTMKTQEVRLQSSLECLNLEFNYFSIGCIKFKTCLNSDETWHSSFCSSSPFPEKKVSSLHPMSEIWPKIIRDQRQSEQERCVWMPFHSWHCSTADAVDTARWVSTNSFKKMCCYVRQLTLAIFYRKPFNW